MDLSLWVALGSLILQAIVAIVAVVWTAGRVARGLEQEGDRKLRLLEIKVDAEVDKLNSRIGEVGNALRTKVTEVEFYVRDNFVTNDVLDKIIVMFGDNMRLQFEGLKGSIEEIRDRLDRERQP